MNRDNPPPRSIDALLDALRSLSFPAEMDEQSQLAAGWMLAAVGQAEILRSAIGTAVAAHTAPNRRLLNELAIQINILADHGEPILEAHKRRRAQASNQLNTVMNGKFDDTKRIAALKLKVDEAADRSRDYLLKQAKATESLGYTDGFYLAWWYYTQLSHATLDVSRAYLPPEVPLKRSTPDWQVEDVRETIFLTIQGALLQTAALLLKRGQIDLSQQIQAIVDEHGTQD